MKRFFRMYCWVLCSFFLATVLLTVAAGYTMRVVCFNSAIAEIDRNISRAEGYLSENENSAALLMEEFEAEYTTKVRTTAMLIDEVGIGDGEQQQLEEIRVAVDATRLDVSDEDGNIIARTGSPDDGNALREEFQGHVQDAVYTDVIFELDEDTPIISAASTLTRGLGLVQLIFQGNTAVTLLKEQGLSNFAADVPLYTDGVTSLLNRETLEYVSCSDDEKVGTTCSYSKDRFKNTYGRFQDENDDGQAVLVKYQCSGDYIILAEVTYHTIYHDRNLVVYWLSFGSFFLLCVTALALRMALLRQKRKERISST